MKYGFFDDYNREYVIETPETPYPWINYLGNENFFGLVSNTSGGYSFYKDARLRRITRYRYNNVPVDMGGRYYYLNVDGKVWNPGWKPMKTKLDKYECRHGMGYSKFYGEKDGIGCNIKMMVPLGYNGEVHKVTVSNEGPATKEVSLYSFIEFCLWDAQDDATNYQRNFNTGEVEVEGSVIYHKTEYRERRDHFSFYSVNAPIQGFDTCRDTFLGENNGFHEAEAVFNNKSFNSVASGWSPIGSHNLRFELKPGETKEFVFIIGYVENEDKWAEQDVINKDAAKVMIDRFKTAEQFNDEMKTLKAYWDKLLSKYTVKSDDEKLNRMVNIWNPYQCMTTFNMSRSASLFESGIGRGMGFRDSNQDLLGFVHQIPERAKERIIDIASTQFEDGSAYHQYQPLTKQGNNDVGSGFNDDPLWLIMGVSAYIKETGDFDILNIQVPFDNDVSKAKSLYEHLKASFYHVVNNKGPNGLPLIGRADWNDCLNLNCHSETPGESFQITGTADGRVAESVFIAGLFVLTGKDFVEISRRMGFEEESVTAQKHLDHMEQSVYDKGYDGDWFLRAYDAFGDKIGSRENKEGKIYIEPQGMCVMAGMGLKNGLAEKALNSVEKLLDSKYGIVLNAPSYTKYDPKIGEITSYPPGYKENGGIFCHNNPWIACAEAELGRGDRAFEVYKKIAPAYLEEVSQIHKTEPYVYSQMIAGVDAANFGQAKNSWLTGTASWNFITITQWILGIKPEFDGLKIEPCIPRGMENYSVYREFRNSKYQIEVHNSQQNSKGVKKIEVDGKAIEHDLLPLFDDDQVHLVHVWL